jgi:hypothetical protein
MVTASRGVDCRAEARGSAADDHDVKGLGGGADAVK